MRGFSLMNRRIPMAGGVFMELFGAVRAFKFMAFAGNAQQRGSHKEQGQSIHRPAS